MASFDMQPHEFRKRRHKGEKEYPRSMICRVMQNLVKRCTILDAEELNNRPLSAHLKFVTREARYRICGSFGNLCKKKLWANHSQRYTAVPFAKN